MKPDDEKIILVSGDGDYKLIVDFLIEEKRFEKKSSIARTNFNDTNR